MRGRRPGRPPPPSTPPPRRHFTFTPSARSIRHTDPFSFLTDFARGISNLPSCWRTWTLEMYLTLDPPSVRSHGEIRSLLSPAPTAQRPPSRGGESNELNDLDSYDNFINQPLRKYHKSTLICFHVAKLFTKPPSREGATN